MTQTKILHGERIGQRGIIRLGCSAVIFDKTREKVLLTRRADNALWCLPGGGVEPGETVEEACLREVWEETGLRIRLARLAGVYSSPDALVIYGDGTAAQIIALNFEAEIVSGEPGLSEETTEWGYFSLAEMGKLEMLLNHAARVREAFEGRPEAFIR